MGINVPLMGINFSLKGMTAVKKFAVNNQIVL